MSAAKMIQPIVPIVALMLACVVVAGCRAHPVSLAITLIGDVVDDKDIQERQGELLGKEPSAADAMFGARHDTLVDLHEDYQWLIYPEPGERYAESFYVAEVRSGKIVALFKCKRNIDGLEDVHHTRMLEGQVFGKKDTECEEAASLDPPILVMRSQASGVIARIYNARNWSHTRGARYCVLVFGREGRCQEVRMIGVTASTRDHADTNASGPSTPPVQN